MRVNNRSFNQLREIKIQKSYLKHAEGSALVQFGQTHVICSASLADGVPRFLKGSQQGWLTAEYGMIPRATLSRTIREVTQGKPCGRTQEIQRLIGRALRNAIDLKAIGERTILIDCDVIQADGGTRTAAITGSCVALYECIQHLLRRNLINTFPLRYLIASVSVGILNGQVLIDLDYLEDSNADTDMNVVMSETERFIEVQGTAERNLYSRQELDEMLELARQGIKQLIAIQKTALNLT